MTYPFLSEDWFAALDRLLAEEGDPELAAKLRGLRINVRVEDEATGKVHEVHYQGCYFRPGFVPEAKALLSTSLTLAYEVMVNKNMVLGVRALATGKAKLKGDRRRLMALRMEKPTPRQAAFEKKVMEMTSL